jgi:hypothetical protein
MPFLTKTGALRAWWSLLMVLVAAFLVAGACVLYTQRVQQESNRKWCDVMVTLDTQTTPATTPQAVDFRRKIHKLRLSLGCGGG